MLPALFCLLWLGTWQVQRLEWKNSLINDFESRATAPPISLPFGALGPDMEFRRVELVGRFDHESELYLTGRTYEGSAGFHVVTPFALEDGRIILVNRGWVSKEYREPGTRPFTLGRGLVSLDAIIRFPARRGYFVPENEPGNGLWFTMLPGQMVAHLGLGENAVGDIYVAALRTGERIELPIGARTKTNLRNAHLGYAITWYGIACSLLGVYLAFHHQAGRLVFRRGGARRRG